MRGEQIKSFFANNLFAACPRYLEGLVATVNAGDIRSETISDVSPANSYEKIGRLAIISVDGAMTKKNSWMNAMCSGFTSYDVLSKYIDMAERDPEVDRVLFNVDTPGGVVDGVDEVGERIFACKKKTATFYNNLGASAGIWAFSASDEIYTNETAQLGSIGVIAGYRDKQDEESSVVLVSKNAENKSCSLKGDCVTRIQERLDHIESIFYARVSRNTGMSREFIASAFKNGGMITAAEARSIGFVKGITTLSQLIATWGTIPTAQMSNKIVSNPKQGVHMEFNEDNFSVITAKLMDAEARIEELTGTAAHLKAEFDATLEAAVAEAETRVREAIECGVSADVAAQMLRAASPAEASLLALKHKTSKGGTSQGGFEAAPEQPNALLEYAEKHKGSIR